MIYIYDILLNWTDGAKIYEFFEWEENDGVEHVKKMPLIKVDTKVFEDFYNKTFKVEETLLNEITSLTEVFQNKSIHTLDYASLFTDGKRAIAIEFDKNGKSICKSAMLLDEEEEILDIAERLDKMELTYQILSDHACFPYMTRKEEKIKKYLLREIKSCYKTKNYSKLKYICSEYFAEISEDMDINYEKLLYSLNNGLDSNHSKLYHLLKLSHVKK